jgi:hypothetical protein
MAPPASRPHTDRVSSLRHDRDALIEANINPTTGLAHDYLNHFNEAIMMLELRTAIPEWKDHLLAWQPKTYPEHFNSSRLKHRALAVTAYESASAETRQKLDDLATAMNAILLSLRERLRIKKTEPISADLAGAATAHLKVLVARAGAVINGGAVGEEEALAGNPQSVVDALLDQ